MSLRRLRVYQQIWLFRPEFYLKSTYWDHSSHGMFIEELYTCHGDLIKGRSVEENSDKVKFTVELQIFEKYYQMSYFTDFPFYLSGRRDPS